MIVTIIVYKNYKWFIKFFSTFFFILIVASAVSKEVLREVHMFIAIPKKEIYLKIYQHRQKLCNEQIVKRINFFTL